MKKVFSTSFDVIHVYAQRTQEEGRSRNCYFYGDKIYSYGSHYLLGEFITNKDNELAIIINDEGYSSTTSKHISEITGATSQYKQFFTKQIKEKLVNSTLSDLRNKLPRANKKHKYIKEALVLIRKYDEFILWKGINYDQDIQEYKDFFSSEECLKILELGSEKDKLAEIALQEKIQKDIEDDLVKFYNYEINSVFRTPNSYLRLSLDKKYVETSQHVKIPIKEATVLYKMILADKDIKGYNIEGYTVIGINGHLKVGCHNIPRAEVDRVGQELLTLNK